MAANDPTYKDLYYIKDATNNVIYQIKAISLKDAISLALSGDVTGSASTTFGSNVTIDAVIADGHVVTSKLGNGSVTNPKIADGTIEHVKLNLVSVANTSGSGIADGQNDKLATHGQVKSYVDGRISGTYKGKKTVTVINTWSSANLSNGEHVRVTGLGTDATTGKPNIGYVQDGYENDTMGAIPVIDGTDLVYFKETTVVNDTPVTIHGWQIMDGEFKLKQSPVDSGNPSQSGALGGVRKTLTRLEQDENGEVKTTFADIPTGSGSGTGLVSLSSATNSDSDVGDGVAATPKAVKAAYDLASGKAAKPSSATTVDHFAAFADTGGNLKDSGKGPSDFATAAQGTKADSAIQGVKVNGTELTPDANKKVDIPLAANSSGTGTDGAMSGADKVKLDGISSGATKVESSQTNGNIKVDGTETTVYTHPTSGANTSKGDTTAQTPGFGGTFKALSATVDAQGHTTALAEHTVTIPSTTATASSSGTGGNAGLMSAADKEKLDDVSVGATKVEASQTNGNVKIDGTETNVYSHPQSGANTSKGDITSQTPGFGGTFRAMSATVDQYGHTTSLADHTVTIPDDVATPSTDGVGGTAGLMSAADKEKLDELASGEATKDKDEVVAAALDDLDARMHAVEETVSAENLGTRTADEIDAQVLKIGGDDVSTLLAGKVDKVEGKGLSKNDFTDAYKSAVDANTSARHTHSNKSVLDGISSSDVNNWNGKQAALTWMTDAEVDALWENAMMAAIAE